MREYQIGEKEAGQTLLKFLQKYLPLAPSSFFYKMLRKKNIKYNHISIQCLSCGFNKKLK